MNRQPYCRPPQWWGPRLTPWLIRLTQGHRRRTLFQRQRVTEVVCDGWEQVSSRWQAGDGVLITPNHSAHYDSTALYIAGDQHDTPLFFMTAWQVFGQAKWWERQLMQRLGCFSIDREANDRQAFKQAIEVLQSGPAPLVIFPEGDIYHTTDYVTPFREGAAAIALSAAKRANRKIWVVPCGIRFRYEDDPMPGILQALEAMERRLHLRVAADLPTPQRIHRLAEAALALKELDYTEHTSEGMVRERIRQLAGTVLARVEARHGLSNEDKGLPERVKAARQTVIPLLEDPADRADADDETGARKSAAPIASPDERRHLEQDMEDLFFVMQLYSYRGDYLDSNPTIERIAETVDKLEEDILDLQLPSVRGRRRVRIELGEPREVEAARGRDAVEELTQWMQQSVQTLVLDMAART
ncbi:MAG: 1-acyl-sn-glycerol-3-phosphate acyltransferase [Planctomycetales bacterium]|nr:1-acyl-sn-glycerol-3-phosphate acyltransferase [Planctomycetales bacterium]